VRAGPKRASGIDHDLVRRIRAPIVGGFPRRVECAAPAALLGSFGALDDDRPVKSLPTLVPIVGWSRS